MKTALIIAAIALAAVTVPVNAQCANGAPPPCVTPRAATRAIDPNVIAVIPFWVTGPDTTLGEGLAQLIADEFTGEGVPRAADPGAVWRAWRGLGGRAGTRLAQATALQIAAQVGAGQVLIGTAVEIRGQLTFTASTFSVPSGAVRARAQPVSDAADSLPALVRRLITSVLAGSSARVIDGIGRAGTSSAEAMRAYIAGIAAHRAGKDGKAQQHFTRALELDSTFALAALGGTVGFNIGPETMQRLAWSLRDRLSARDRALLVAYVGPNYPDSSTTPERLRALENAVAAFPDNADLLYVLGDTYFHNGFLVGFADGLERAQVALLRALAADSMFAAPLVRLIHYATARGDTASVRRYGERLLRDTAVSLIGYSVRWQVAVASRDRRLIDRALQWLDSTGNAANVIEYDGLWDSTGMANATRLLAIAARRATTDSAVLRARRLTSTVERNRGRPKAAHLALSGTGSDPDAGGVYEWLYGDGDSASGLATVQSLQAIAGQPPAASAADRRRQYEAMCLVEQWRLSRGETESAQRTVDRLSRAAAPADAPGDVGSAHLCATALTALRAVREKLPAMDAAVAALDSAVWNFAGKAGLDQRTRHTMLLAQLYERRGDIADALRTIRRRFQFWSFPHSELLAASLREEGRLAVLSGDRDGAIKAYRWYLTLVTDPEAALVPRRDQVLAELGRLLGAR